MRITLYIRYCGTVSCYVIWCQTQDCTNFPEIQGPIPRKDDTKQVPHCGPTHLKWLANPTVIQRFVLVARKVILCCVIPQESAVLSYLAAEDWNHALHTSVGRLLYVTSRDTKYFVSNDILLDSWTLRMGPISCPETSVGNYHYSLRNNREVLWY